MNVLHMFDTMNRSGPEMIVLDFCRNIRGKDLRVVILTAGKCDIEADILESGIELIRLKRRYPLDLALIRQIRTIIYDHSIDVLHIHQEVIGIHAYFAALGTGTRLVLGLHVYAGDMKNKLARRFLMPRMHANIAVSNVLKEEIQNALKHGLSDNFVVIYNGIDPLRLSAGTGVFRKSLGLARSTFLLGMIGHFKSVRDQITICRSLPQIIAEVPDIKFVFVGGRNPAQPIFFDQCVKFCRDAGIEEKVVFLGQRKDINDILNSLDIFVYSSDHDTFGNAVIEAMVSGIPVIVNDLPVLVETTEGGKHCILFRTKDEHDLAEKVLLALKNFDQTKKMGKEAMKWARQRYSVDRYVDDLEKLYRSL